MANNKQLRKRKKTLNWVYLATTWTFFLAIAFAFITRVLVQKIESLIFSFLILFSIILLGILFDTVGTAVTAAEEKPFHAKASKKIYGAKKGIYLVRHADQVANFCNDVVGDICGVISGIIGATIIFKLVYSFPGLEEIYLSIFLAGLVSALTVGGKAVGKYMAINNSTEIVFLVARLLTSLEKVLFWKKNRNY